MGMEDAPKELYQEFMHDISDEIDRESKIIDDLLTLVRMDKASSRSFPARRSDQRTDRDGLKAPAPDRQKTEH